MAETMNANVCEVLEKVKELGNIKDEGKGVASGASQCEQCLYKDIVSEQEVLIKQLKDYIQGAYM